MENYADIERTINYAFQNRDFLEQALVVAGSAQTQSIPGKYNCGNKRLALIGDALLCLSLVDEWFDEDKSRGNRPCNCSMAVVFADFIVGECERKVQSVASNEHLQRQGYRMGFQEVVFNNPSHDGEVPRTAMASTMEAVIGATWIDSGKDWKTVCSVAKIISQAK